MKRMQNVIFNWNVFKNGFIYKINYISKQKLLYYTNIHITNYIKHNKLPVINC